MIEYLLSVDKFEKPKTVKDKDATFMLLYRLLLLTPGSIQTHPTMGVGIVTKWRYMDMAKIPELQTEISRQISQFLPTLQGADVEIEPSDSEDKAIVIKISVDNTLYAFEANDKVLSIKDL